MGRADPTGANRLDPRDLSTYQPPLVGDEELASGGIGNGLRQAVVLSHVLYGRHGLTATPAPFLTTADPALGFRQDPLGLAGVPGVPDPAAVRERGESLYPMSIPHPPAGLG
jgi:hypothetical protein